MNLLGNCFYYVAIPRLCDNLIDAIWLLQEIIRTILDFSIGMPDDLVTRGISIDRLQVITGYVHSGNDKVMMEVLTLAIDIVSYDGHVSGTHKSVGLIIHALYHSLADEAGAKLPTYIQAAPFF
jgi:hypothetical protein